MTVTMQEAQQQLPELIAKLLPGEELVITDADRPVARLKSEPPRERKVRPPGSMKGQILYMADDFDAPLEDFKDYM